MSKTSILQSPNEAMQRSILVNEDMAPDHPNPSGDGGLAPCVLCLFPSPEPSRSGDTPSADLARRLYRSSALSCASALSFASADEPFLFQHSEFHEEVPQATNLGLEASGSDEALGVSQRESHPPSPCLFWTHDAPTYGINDWPDDNDEGVDVAPPATCDLQLHLDRPSLCSIEGKLHL